MRRAVSPRVDRTMTISPSVALPTAGAPSRQRRVIVQLRGLNQDDSDRVLLCHAANAIAMLLNRMGYQSMRRFRSKA